MMIVLYHSPYSTCSQKVRLSLFEKNLPFEAKTLHFWRGDHLTPEYLAINPNGVVPTLVHNGEIVIDSSVICEYLDDVFPACNLSPQSAVDRARMRAWLRYIEEVPTPAIRVPSFNQVFLDRLKEMSDDTLNEQVEVRPLRKHFYREMGRTGFSQARYDEAIDKLDQTLGRMEASLTKSCWICGGDFTLADICLIPTMDRMQDLGLGSRWSALPQVTRWWSAAQALDCYAKTYPAGSRLSEIYKVKAPQVE
jgi:glutathione S-transferase